MAMTTSVNNVPGRKVVGHARLVRSNYIECAVLFTAWAVGRGLNISVLASKCM